MKHLKLFNNESNYNIWLTSDNFVTPYVSKLKSNSNINYQQRLPYDAEIEYLQSSGTQWIDTRIIPTPNTKCQIKFNNISATGDVIFGYDTGNDQTDYRFFNNGTNLYFDILGDKNQKDGNRIMSNIYKINMNIIYELELGNYYVKDLTTNDIIVQSEFVDDFGNIENTITLNHSINRNSHNKWYYVKIFNNNRLILDLIPVKKDGIGYMYDKISNQLFSNQGTGQFILGPDK